MSKYTDGALALDSLAAQYKALIDLADVLRGMGSIEQAGDEAHARMVEAVKAEADALQGLDTATAHAAAAREGTEQLLADTAATVKAELAGAKVAAADITRQASLRADKRRVEADDKAQTALDATDAEIAKRRQTLTELEQSVTGGLLDLKTAQDELAVVQGELHAFRARFAALVKE